MLAFERLDSCREPNRFAAWLMTIVRNQARNWLDKRRLRDVLPVEPAETAVETSVGNEPNVQKRQMLRALEGLSPVECEVVMLHDLEGYTHEEIGDTLGISCVMSRQHLFVSRKKLRQALGIVPGRSEAEGDEGYHG
jgi:RNA polymerase sigma-70 factor (ECF subfamily)